MLHPLSSVPVGTEGVRDSGREQESQISIQHIPIQHTPYENCGALGNLITLSKHLSPHLSTQILST